MKGAGDRLGCSKFDFVSTATVKRFGKGDKLGTCDSRLTDELDSQVYICAFVFMRIELDKSKGKLGHK